MSVRSPEWVNSKESGALTTEDLYEAMNEGGLLESIDLESLLRSSVKEGISLTPQRLADYSLLPLRVAPEKNMYPPYHFGYAEGFYDASSGTVQAKEYNDGRFYKIFLNDRIGVALSYKGSPQALAAFSVEESGELCIRQIQGIQSYTRPIHLSPRDIRGSRGLMPFHYPQLMVRSAEAVARAAGISSVAVEPAWMVSLGQANKALGLERATRIYDSAPQSLGYEQDSDILWRKAL